MTLAYSVSLAALCGVMFLKLPSLLMETLFTVLHAEREEDQIAPLSGLSELWRIDVVPHVWTTSVQVRLQHAYASVHI